MFRQPQPATSSSHSHVLTPDSKPAPTPVVAKTKSLQLNEPPPITILCCHGLAGVAVTGSRSRKTDQVSGTNTADTAHEALLLGNNRSLESPSRKTSPMLNCYPWRIHCEREP